MADGRSFQGKQAIAAGLVDSVSSLDQLISDLSAKGPKVATQNPKNKESGMITKEKVSAEYPEIAEAFRAEGRAGVDVSSAKADGASEERERIKDVFAQSMPGHESIVESMAFDGKSTGGDVAKAIVAAERANRGARVDSMRSESPKPVPPANANHATTNDQNLSIEERAQKAWDNDSSLHAEFDEFSDYLAYEKGQAKGSVKLFSRKGN